MRYTYNQYYLRKYKTELDKWVCSHFQMDEFICIIPSSTLIEKLALSKAKIVLESKIKETITISIVIPPKTE